MMNRIILVVAVLIAILLSSSLYTVKETQVALKLRLGEIVSIESEPGLKFKTPFVNNVVRFDKRIQTLDSAAESFLTVEKKNVVVDSFVKWRIVDTQKFYISTGGVMAQANLRLAQNNQDALRSEFSKRTILEVISDQREAIMASVKGKLKTIAEDKYGIEVVDVRIKRIELSQEVRNSVYSRMETERKGLANSIALMVLRKPKSFKLLQIRSAQLFSPMHTEILKRFEVKATLFRQVTMLKPIAKMLNSTPSCLLYTSDAADE